MIDCWKTLDDWWEFCFDILDANFNTARYILELSLMEYRLNVEISESVVAVAALVLALKMKNIEVNAASGYCWWQSYSIMTQGWVATLKYYSGVDFAKVFIEFKNTNSKLTSN